MVEDDLSESAADTIERLLQYCLNGQTPSQDQICEAVQLREALRAESDTPPWEEYDVPVVGETVYDSDKPGPWMEVVEVYDEPCDEYKYDGITEVYQENKNHPPDAPVVGAKYEGTGPTYHFPATRLEW